MFGLGENVGALDPAFLQSLRADPEAFRALASGDKVTRAARRAAPRSATASTSARARSSSRHASSSRTACGSGRAATVVCEEVVAIGELSQFGADLELRCRRAFLGAGIWGGRSIRFGGGGHRDPWATLAVGDLAFVGDEAFVNVCRPVLIGREVFLTMRSIIVTHNIGHSVLEGFENRFAPVVLEDRSQVGLGAVLYAGARIGAEAIVASNSYVVGDIPAGAFAIGVPAKVTGSSSHKLSDSRRVETRAADDRRPARAARPPRSRRVSAIARTTRLRGRGHAGALHARASAEAVDAPAVVLALDVRGDVPDGVAVIDLAGRQVHGSGGVVLDSVREFCRKRGIKLEPGPWSYPGGLI